MPIGKGPHQFGRDLGAPNRGRACAKSLMQHGNVKAAKVEKLKRGRVGQQALKVRRAGLALVDLHDMRMAIARRISLASLDSWLGR